MVKGKSNPVAKFSKQFNKGGPMRDRKKDDKRGYQKHKKQYKEDDQQTDTTGHTNAAAKRPQNYVDPETGKTKTRMVPVHRDVQNEKLNPSDGIKAYIDDFKKSDAPQFKGKSDAKKKEMAIAAYLDAKRGEKKEACWTGYKQAGMKKKGDKVVPNCVPENYRATRAQSNAANKMYGRTSDSAPKKPISKVDLFKAIDKKYGSAKKKTGVFAKEGAVKATNKAKKNRIDREAGQQYRKDNPAIVGKPEPKHKGYGAQATAVGRALRNEDPEKKARLALKHTREKEALATKHKREKDAMRESYDKSHSAHRIARKSATGTPGARAEYHKDGSATIHSGPSGPRTSTDNVNSHLRDVGAEHGHSTKELGKKHVTKHDGHTHTVTAKNGGAGHSIHIKPHGVKEGTASRWKAQDAAAASYSPTKRKPDNRSIDAIRAKHRAAKAQKPTNEALSPMDQVKLRNLKRRVKQGDKTAAKQLAAFQKSKEKDIKVSKSTAAKAAPANTKGDTHIVMQLRKAQDVGGNMDLKVSPTGKKVRLSKGQIDSLLKKHDGMSKPRDKRMFRVQLTRKLRGMAK
jgi:hypothetical protein